MQRSAFVPFHTPVVASPKPLIGDVVDEAVTWRIVYRTDPDAIVIAGVFSKKTPHTSKHVIVDCQRRLRRYDQETI